MKQRGTKKEGVIRDAEWLYDHYVDHVLYAMLKREWEGEQADSTVPVKAAPSASSLVQ